MDSPNRRIIIGYSVEGWTVQTEGLSLYTVLKDGQSKLEDLTGDKLHQSLLQYNVEKQSPVLVEWLRNATILHILQNHLKL